MAYADLSPAEQKEIKDYWALNTKLSALLRKEELWGLDAEERNELEDAKQEMKERFDE